MVLGLGLLLASLWLTARWLQRRPASERWLGLLVLLPLLGVSEHWWHAQHPLQYYRDSVAAHVWLAAFQIFGILAVARLASLPDNSSAGVPKRDDTIGLVLAGLAGLCAAMFITAYSDHTGAWVPPFPENAPMWWRRIGWHGWLFWLLTGIGLLVSSRAMRRGRAAGYVGLAVVVSFVALTHWEKFQSHDAASIGASAGSVAAILIVCALCWMLAAHRLLAPRAGRVTAADRAR
jgi:hypothetical protein